MKKKTDWVNVHDDALMISLGLRLPKRVPRDPSVWTKTPKEKAVLKKYKDQDTTTFVCKGVAKFKPIPVYDKCILQLKKSDKYTVFDNTLGRRVPQTVISIQCSQSDIPNLIAKYKDVLVKYHWNGRDYLPNQIPYWK